MSRYALNLPIQLKREAEEIAARQGISLNQFIMWSVSEKVASLRQDLDDPNFPQITYRRGPSGWINPVLRGTGIRVQTIISDQNLGLTWEEIAKEYDLDINQVREAEAFYKTHKTEIDLSIETEQKMESEHDQSQITSRR